MSWQLINLSTPSYHIYYLNVLFVQSNLSSACLFIIPHSQVQFLGLHSIDKPDICLFIHMYVLNSLITHRCHLSHNVMFTVSVCQLILCSILCTLLDVNIFRTKVQRSYGIIPSAGSSQIQETFVDLVLKFC